jgi:hypothetical protein
VVFRRHSSSRVGLWYNEPQRTIREQLQRRNILKRIAITLLTALLLAPSTTLGQTRRRSSSPRPPTQAQAQARVSQVRTAGATKVADQIKHLTRFIYVLGSVTSGIAAADEAARRNEGNPALVQESRAKVKSSIAGFRESLDRLEIEFRATPELQPYYIKLAGVAAGAASAEQEAAANRFDASGRSLLNVVGRLADVLVVMRQ